METQAGAEILGSYHEKVYHGRLELTEPMDRGINKKGVGKAQRLRDKYLKGLVLEEQFAADHAVANFQCILIEQGQIGALSDGNGTDFIFHSQHSGRVGC